MPEPKPSNPMMFNTGEDFAESTADRITLRDLFAAAALVGMVASQSNGTRLDREHGILGFARASKASYFAADAMLAEREKREGADDGE